MEYNMDSSQSAFLYWIFKKFLFDRVMGVINQRDEMIQKQFSEAKKSQERCRKLKERL